MKTFILGQRSGGERGVFIAPPGVDADTATADELLLHISNFVDQIVIRGSATGAFPVTVPLGLTYAPAAILFPVGTASFTFFNADGSFNSAAGYGVSRPMPNYWNSATWSATMGSSSMSVNASGVVTTVGYIVFNRAAP